MKESNSETKDISKYLYAPTLSISGNIYQRKITDGLWAIISRAKQIAKKEKSTLIKNGYEQTVDIKGRPKGISPITFVIYHVPFNKEEDKSIGSFDVPKIDHSKIKHLELVRWTIKAIQEVCPDSEIVICTDEIFGGKIRDLNPTILLPSVERNRPMYYRAKTYNTLIQKRWISGTTVFLDSDAIVLKNPIDISKEIDFNVGVTARFAPNLMPINEGVIIAESGTQECVDFFAHYIGTYNAIKDDKLINEITQNDLMRWRGGQLSLNAICGGIKMNDFRDSDGRIKILPCSKYNYAVRSKEEVEGLKKENNVYIAHIKGKAKYE